MRATQFRACTGVKFDRAGADARSMVGAHIPARERPVPRRGRLGVHASESGFTLIELVIVAVITAIMFAIVLPSIQNARKAPEGPGLEVAASSLWRGMSRYRADYRGAFPPSGAIISASGQGSVQAAGTALKGTLKGPSGQPYMERFPVLPNDSERPIRVYPAKPASSSAPYLVLTVAGQSGRLEAYDSRGARRWCRAVETISSGGFEMGGAGRVAC
jgi:prepilin-type N-terminal cleavage/methylation domain-containing protein